MQALTIKTKDSTNINPQMIVAVIIPNLFYRLHTPVPSRIYPLLHYKQFLPSDEQTPQRDAQFESPTYSRVDKMIVRRKYRILQ